MSENGFIGVSVPRLEGEDKVTGRLKYLADLKLAGSTHGKVLRSPVAHARIVAIDASAAARMPGVVAVLTRDDVIGNPRYQSHYGPVVKDQPIVALDRVRYVGDPVAAVAATHPDVAAEALERIEVEYDELPIVMTPAEALAEGAPVLHEQVERPRLPPMDMMHVSPPQGTNLCAEFHLALGDVEQGFADADLVFENVFTSPGAQHAALETFTTVARFDHSRQLTVWSTVQNPFVVREQLAEVFRMPLSKVRVIATHLGGGYGSKLYPKLEPLTAALAWKARRPVSITLTREEVFQTITKHAATVWLKTGVTRDGRILARHCRVELDTGAYAEVGPRVCKKAGVTAAGPYRIPNLRIDAFSAYTNKTPAGAFRGFGVSQTAWAHESEMDLIARALGIDPLELRRRNLYRDGDAFVTGDRLHDLGLAECAEKVAAAIGWDDRPLPPAGRRAGGLPRGKGLACTMKGTVTPSVSSAFLRLNEDGSATVYVGTADVGQGSVTVMAQIAATELAIPLEQVHVQHSDTDLSLYDLTTSSSRSTFHMGLAVREAARDAARQLRAIAAPQLGVAEVDVELRDQHAGGVSYEALLLRHFGAKGGNLLGKSLVGGGRLRPDGKPLTSYFWFVGAGSAEVEVDPETGRVRVLRMATAADVGNPLNPFLCEQQLRGAAIMGLGMALTEELVHQDGLLVNPNFLDYNLPRFLDLPDELEAILVATPHPDGPYGAKGLGETGLIPVAPAIANAIEDAVGVRIRDLPITPEKVLAALREKAERDARERPADWVDALAGAGASHPSAD